MKTKDDKKFDMYNYIETGNTMYDVLDQYLPELNGDYSLCSLVNALPEFAETNPYDTDKILEVYQDYFDKLSCYLSDCLNSYPRQNNLFQKKREKILLALEEASPDYQKFNSVDGYITYAKYNMKSDKTQKVRDIIIKEAIDLLPQNVREVLKCKCLKGYYFTQIANRFIRNKNRVPDKNTPEFQEFKFIQHVLSNVESMKEYDSCIEEYRRRTKKVAEEIIFKSKRKREIMAEIKNGLNDKEQEKILDDDGIEKILFPKPNNSTLEKYAYEWNIRRYRNPKILFDTQAIYSEDGSENQRVMAVKYGEFDYNAKFNRTGENKISSTAMELIGITRSGKDGFKNYFVLVPVNNLSIKKDSEISEQDRIKNIVINGKKRTLIDKNTHEPIYFVKNDSISKAEEEFYAKVAFSDEILNHVIKSNYRYAGSVISEQGKLKLDATSSVTPTDIEAAKYASLYPGRVGRTQYESLTAYCNSPELLSDHMDIIKKLLGEKANPELNPKNQGEPR